MRKYSVIKMYKQFDIPVRDKTPQVMLALPAMYSSKRWYMYDVSDIV